MKSINAWGKLCWRASSTPPYVSNDDSVLIPGSQLLVRPKVSAVVFSMKYSGLSILPMSWK
ncbi:MAG: hypothetical protein Ct9H300mP1_14910 [Planctomycetaceae bacterium]|nr:MAG: hypothetical protein Ct9H300mP1_14910 [Planctomycetaceae bacterium]